MVKYIIHTADIHIRNHRRLDEYQEKLQWFIDKCNEFVSEHNSDEVRIVIAGDLVNNFTELSPECYITASWFLNQLDKICKTLVFAGNHDITKNEDRLDSLTTIFSMCNFMQTYYLDKELEYQSGCVADDGIIWCLYSSFDNFNKPNIDETRITNPDETYVGLFHGEITSAKTDAGFQSINGFDSSYFEGIDFGLLGHIHKRQMIKNDGVPLVYCGSLIQKDHGENISKHGFIIWDVEEQTFEEVDYTDDTYGFYTFKINNVSDLDDDEEEVINL